MARGMSHKQTQRESWSGRGGRGPLTVADLCRAIEERRIPTIRQRDAYILTRRDLRRWLEGSASRERSVS